MPAPATHLRQTKAAPRPAATPARPAAPVGRTRMHAGAPAVRLAAAPIAAQPTPSVTPPTPARPPGPAAPPPAPAPARPGPAPAPATGPPSRGAAPFLSQIAAAPKSAVQAEALTQAHAVDNDCTQGELAVSRLASARRRQVQAFFAGARHGLSAFFARTIAALQAFFLARQAQILGAVARALAWIRASVARAVAAMRALGRQIRTRVHTLLENLKAAVRTSVDNAASSITGLIDEAPIPDIPIIGPAIRRGVSWLLGRAARVVSAAFSALVGFIQFVFDAGMRLLDAVLAVVGHLLDAALAVVSMALLALLRMITSALIQAAVWLARGLARVLTAVLNPLLHVVELMILGMIAVAERTAIALLRRNREEYLTALADVVGPKLPLPGARVGSDMEVMSVMQRLARDALENAARIVLTFQLVVGNAVTAVVRLIANAASRAYAAISGLLASVYRFLAGLVSSALAAITRLIEKTVEYIGALLSALVRGVIAFAEALRDLAAGSAGRLLRFISDALDAIGRFLSRFISNLLHGRSIADALWDALGEFLPSRPGIAYRGPDVPPPHVVIGIILAIVIAVAALFGITVVVAGSVVFIIIGGVTYTTSVAVVVAVFVVVVLLLALLIWLIYKWITKPKPPPPKRVIRVDPSTLELGVGGRDIRATATIAPGIPARPWLWWRINPGSATPSGVKILGWFAPTVGVRASHPSHATVTGGVPIVIRAQLFTNPADYADSVGVMLVQVVSASYAAAPPLVPVPPNPNLPPPNTAEPNRDGIGGNTAAVNAVTAPAGRPPVDVTFRRSLGATVAGTTITPGSITGDIQLRIRDTATDAMLDETKRSTAGPARRMAEVTVNAVATNVTKLTFAGIRATPYGIRSKITFSASDTLHPPLTRIVGELITGVADDFNVNPPNNGFNPGFRADLAVPANTWTDQLTAGLAIPNVADGLPAIDVNRFVGPGVPALPRQLVYRQQFQYASWQGGGAVTSATLPPDGRHTKTLHGTPPKSFKFKIAHTFAGTAVSRDLKYAGNDLIIFKKIKATPDGAGARALAADGVATAQVGVTTNVPGRSVQWTALGGGMAFIAGNPATPPATATLRAGLAVGTHGVRAEDTVWANRQLDGNVRVVAVALRRMSASPNPVRSGRASSTVRLNADPGGRTVQWSVDATAHAAGVTVAPATTGPQPPRHSTTVTRPAGYTGIVTVTAADSVLAGTTASTTVDFR